MENSFSEVLKGLMIETNISTNKLALDLGVGVHTVNRWKNGSRGSNISLLNLISLCKYFGCSLDYLVGKTDYDSKPKIIALDNFGKRVREIMESKRITTYRMRNETKFGGNHFHDWDNGADPKLNTLIELAKYFDCTLDELVGFE